MGRWPVTSAHARHLRVLPGPVSPLHCTVISRRLCERHPRVGPGGGPAPRGRDLRRPIEGTATRLSSSRWPWRYTVRSPRRRAWSSCRWGTNVQGGNRWPLVSCPLLSHVHFPETECKLLAGGTCPSSGDEHTSGRPTSPLHARVPEGLPKGGECQGSGPGVEALLLLPSAHRHRRQRVGRCDAHSTGEGWARPGRGPRAVGSRGTGRRSRLSPGHPLRLRTRGRPVDACGTGGDPGGHTSRGSFLGGRGSEKARGGCSPRPAHLTSDLTGRRGLPFTGPLTTPRAPRTQRRGRGVHVAPPSQTRSPRRPERLGLHRLLIPLPPDNV